MKSLNKSLLAAAVVGAIALPSLVSAATFNYTNGTQITLARDLIATNGNIMVLPTSLTLEGDRDSVQEATNIEGTDGILTNNQIRVRVALVGGAQFSSTPTAEALAAQFVRGNQAGGGGPIGDIATGDLVSAGFTNNNTELTFVFEAASPGILGTNALPEIFLTLPALRVTNLVSQLGAANGSVVASVDVYNVTRNRTILSATNTIVRSIWGEVINSLNLSDAPAAYDDGVLTPGDKALDVASQPNRKTRYAPNGRVGDSNPNRAAAQYFNAGAFEMDIAKANPIGVSTPAYINHANAPTQYNLISSPPAQIVVRVQGDNLSPWATIPAGIWITNSATCGRATADNSVSLNVNTTTNVASTAPIPATHPLFVNLTNTVPAATLPIHVCLGSDSTTELLPQPNLRGSVEVTYQLPDLRQNPPVLPFRLAPLLQNGAVVYFQNVNPAGNTTAESFLRVTNHNTFDCPIYIDAKDDLGRHSGEVRLTLEPHASEQLNINVLESGNDPRFAANGGFGDGAGKWYVRVSADCSNFTASALNRNSTTGVVTDLTPEKGDGIQWSTPTIPVP